MKKRRRMFYSILIVSALTIICIAATFYVKRMNRAISDNIIGSISEIAAHDKATIQAYIELCWEDLYEIQKRFISYDCTTTKEVESKIRLECSSSEFTHIYLLAEDGTVYTDSNATYLPGSLSQDFDLMSYFANGETKIIARFNSTPPDGQEAQESIIYGVRLENFSIAGKKMAAFIGVTDISAIQNKMVIDSFIKDGKVRGHSALINMSGNYIVDINKGVYTDSTNNLYTHLAVSASSELTNEEVAEKLSNRETFGFYHSHKGEKDKELYYFIPFESGIGLYFIMSVNEEVFLEQTRAFMIMGMITLVVSISTVVIMLLVVMFYQIKTVLTTEKARAQKEFLSNMSHEIRTPLNGLIGMNHLIMAHIDDDSQKLQIKEWLKKSHSTANYLLSLVNDVLDMSKLQEGKVDLINEPMMISTVMDEVYAMQADNIKNRGIEFTLEKDIIAPCIEGDITRIKQILMNIVGNAAKFTPEGKYIRLSVCQKPLDEDHVTTIFECEDTGIGISKEYIGKIFDSFSQERNKNTNGIKGTGLGMSISKLLANAMGGDISVESEPNVGSTFTVTVPFTIVKDIPDYMIEEEKSEDSAEDTANSKNSRPVKILVAEDVELNAEILLEILGMEGFETAHAKNGQEALDLFSNSEIGEFDIILMDMQMPVMDGCTASKEIRALAREDAKTIKIYACTANTFQEDREMALGSGMDDFLTKPIDVNALLKKIGRATK